MTLYATPLDRSYLYRESLMVPPDSTNIFEVVGTMVNDPITTYYIFILNAIKDQTLVDFYNC